MKVTFFNRFINYYFLEGYLTKNSLMPLPLKYQGYRLICQPLNARNAIIRNTHIYHLSCRCICIH